MKRQSRIKLDNSLKEAAELTASINDSIKNKIGRPSEKGAKIKIIGVYKITPSKKSIQKAAIYHGHEYLLDKKGVYAEKIYRLNFRNLSLVEIEAEGGFWIDKIHLNTEGTKQAPYLEFYLNENGTDVTFDPSRDKQIISMFKTQADAFEKIINDTNKRRICFFLHFVYPSAPLVVGDRIFSLPELTELPERLKAFVHYLPID